jgi:hypothetical protein
VGADIRQIARIPVYLPYLVLFDEPGKDAERDHEGDQQQKSPARGNDKVRHREERVLQRDHIINVSGNAVQDVVKAVSDRLEERTRRQFWAGNRCIFPDRPARIHEVGKDVEHYCEVGYSKCHSGRNQGGDCPRSDSRGRRHGVSDDKEKADNQGSDPYKILERIDAGSAEHFRHRYQSFHFCAFASARILSYGHGTPVLLPAEDRNCFQVIFLSAGSDIIRHAQLWPQQ